MEHMLKMNEAQVLAETRGGVARAREHTDDVEFSPQDATRTPLDFMLEVLADRGRGRRHDAEHPRHRRLRDPLGLRGPDPVHPQGGPRRLRPVDPLPQRPGPRHRQHPGRGAGRGAPGRGVRQRPRRARRERRSRRGRDGGQDPPRPVPRRHHDGAHRRAGAHLAPGEPAHRLSGAVQQGRRGTQRLRPRVGHPPARGARRPVHVRDHRRRRAWAR